MKLFFSVGEPSGDQHAAHLIEAFQRRAPQMEFVGFGGPMMERAGCRLNYQLTNLAVMGFLRVVPLLKQFYDLVQNADHLFKTERPDAVILVDFPGFNWWVARKAKAAGIPVFYYLPPQLWVWAPWRINKMRAFVDHVLCGLSFEPEWYAKRGMRVDYVGHPFFDEVAEHNLDQAFVDEQWQRPGRIVGVLPGSRNHEVEKNWPLQVQVMQRLRARHADIRFVVANYREQQQARCEAMLEEMNDGQTPLPIEFHTGRTPEIIEMAECCLMVSGSVSLELLARRTPAAVVYQGSIFLWFLKLALSQVNSMTLPNLMAGRTIFPEQLVILRKERAVERLTESLDLWLSDESRRLAVVNELDDLARRVARTGASSRAADTILSKLSTPNALRRAA
jgi:lipid-A-disaccharide synthase